MAAAGSARSQLSLMQIVASALAAVSAAVAASFIGVYGTVIGAALMSVVSTAGATLYEYYMHRTRTGIRRIRDQGEGTGARQDGGRLARLRQQLTRLRRPGRWKAVGVGSLLVFALAMGTITLIELGAGRPVASVFTGSTEGAGGTSVGRAFGGQGPDGGGSDPSGGGSSSSGEDAGSPDDGAGPAESGAPQEGARDQQGRGSGRGEPAPGDADTDAPSTDDRSGSTSEPPSESETTPPPDTSGGGTQDRDDGGESGQPGKQEEQEEQGGQGSRDGS